MPLSVCLIDCLWLLLKIEATVGAARNWKEMIQHLPDSLVLVKAIFLLFVDLIC